MEQKDLFPSMLRKGLAGVSPVAFPLAEHGADSVETTPSGRVISEDEYWEGRVFYRGERYTFRFPPRPDRGLPTADYCVTRVNSARDRLWSLHDHPLLVLEVLNIERHLYPWVHPDYLEKWKDERSRHIAYAVREEEMHAFLRTYGPLTPSFMPPANRPMPGPMLDELSQFSAVDHRLHTYEGVFSRPVASLHIVAEDAHEDPQKGIVSCLTQIDMSPPRTLYRALLLQLLEHLLVGNPLHPCEGCGQWFSFTDDETQARHRAGWKRRDARYHSRACLKASSERRRRARLRAAA